MNDKDRVLTCVGEVWQTILEITKEVAFVYKAEYTDAHIIVAYLLIFQLKSDHLVEEHDFGDTERLNVYRLLPLGKQQQAELLANNPDIVRRQEDFLFANVPA